MANEPVKVSANAGLIDGIQALARYLVVIIGFITAMLALIQAHDIGGMIAYIQTHGGEVLGAVSGLIALATAAYGIFKTHKRADQLVTVAVDPEVPDHVATVK